MLAPGYQVEDGGAPKIYRAWIPESLLGGVPIRNFCSGWQSMEVYTSFMWDLRTFAKKWNL